jgi:hypothetical protein
VYRFLRDSFNAILESRHLTYSYELPQSTSVTELITRVVSDMQSCPYSYQFTTSHSTASLLVHEAHPLQILEIVNRGVPRNDGEVRLRRANHTHVTLGNLVQNRYFAVPNIAIEGTSFIIHLSESALGVHNVLNLIFDLTNSCSQVPLDCHHQLRYRCSPTPSLVHFTQSLFCTRTRRGLRRCRQQ